MDIPNIWKQYKCHRTIGKYDKLTVINMQPSKILERCFEHKSDDSLISKVSATKWNYTKSLLFFKTILARILYMLYAENASLARTLYHRDSYSNNIVWIRIPACGVSTLIFQDTWRVAFYLKLFDCVMTHARALFQHAVPPLLIWIFIYNLLNSVIDIHQMIISTF